MYRIRSIRESPPLKRANFRKMFGLMILVLGWSRATPNPVPPPKAITWTPGAFPQIFNVIKSDQASIDILLLEAPILRVKTTHSKVILRKIPIFFDISHLALKTHNLKKSLTKLHSMEFKLKSRFFSCQGCANEFLIHSQPLSFNNCLNLCRAQSSEMFTNVEQFKELHQTNITAFELSNIWIQSEQKAIYKGYYDAHHFVNIKLGKKSYSLLPKNSFSVENKSNKVHCFTHYIQGFKQLNCTNLPVKTRYFQRENHENVYYGKKFYALQVKMILDSSYDLTKSANLTNLSFVDFQRKFASFDILTAPAQDELLSVRHFAKCICTRPSFWSVHEHQRVKSKIENLALKSQNLHLGVERIRLQGSSGLEHKSAEDILRILPQEIGRKPPDIFLQKSDVQDLILNSSLNSFFPNSSDGASSSLPLEHTTLSAILQNSTSASRSNEDELIGQQQFFPLEFQTRNTRAIPIAAASLLAKHAGPYLLSQSPAIMSSLAEKLSAVLMKEGTLDKVKQKASNISQYFSELFGKDLIINKTKNKFVADYPSLQNLIVDEKDSKPFDQAKLTVLEKAITKLEYFEKTVVSKLQTAFFHRLSPFIKSKIRPGGKVLAIIEKSRSFVKFLYVYEENVSDSAVSKYQFSSLPRYRTGSIYTSFEIQNLTLDLSQNADMNIGHGEVLNCHQLLLASIALPLEDNCPTQEEDVKDIVLLQAAASLLFYRFQGFITLHFKCKGFPADSISLKEEINLVMIHNSCQISATLISGRNWQQNAVHSSAIDPFANFGVTPLLSYSLTMSSSFQDKTTVFLISLAVIIAVLGILISAVIWGFLKFKNTLQLATLSAYFENGKPNLQSVDLMDPRLFSEERLTPARSILNTEQRRSKSNTRECSPPPSVTSEPPLLPLPSQIHHSSISPSQTQASKFARCLKTVERKASSPASHHITAE